MSYDALSTTELYANSYALAERLGTGGTGTVYRAQHVTLQQERALKILHRRRGTSAAETLAQLQLEASVFGRLKGNRSIVMPFDIGFDVPSQTHFLAMEMLAGADLGRWVNAQGPLSVERTLGVMRQVAAGLDAAHAYVDGQGRATPIIHRDLTPSNLFLLDPTGVAPQVKILDFGLAAVLDRTNAARQRRTGTALFRSYEQANELELVPQTDVWALGLVVYFVLTGHTYWRQRSPRELHDEITTGPLDAPSVRLQERVPDARLPKSFDEWLLRCLQRAPARRFATAGEAIDELALCLEQADVDPLEPLLTRRQCFGAGSMGGPSRSHLRSVAVTDLAPSTAADLRLEEELDSPLLLLAARFHPLLRNVLRVSDDLMTATGHYLAFPPQSQSMLQRQLDGVRLHVSKYNEARDLLRRQLGAYEGLLRRLHGVAPLALYDAARDALSMALAFTESFPMPAPCSADVLSAFAAECTYWQAERVLLHAQLEVGRMRVRSLEQQLEAASTTLPLLASARHEQALRGAALLERYAESMLALATSVRAWIAQPTAREGELREPAWAMAPAIEAMNERYVEVDGGALALRVALCGSQLAFHRRVADGLSSAHDFQWYEFRPLLNGPLVQLIRYLCSDSNDTLVAALEEDHPRWHRLARTLERASERYRVGSGAT